MRVSLYQPRPFSSSSSRLPFQRSFPPLRPYTNRHFSQPDTRKLNENAKPQSYNLPEVSTLIKEGMTLLDQKKISQSIEKFSKAIKIDKTSAEAFCALGFALSASGERGLARENFRKAIKLKPNYTDAHQGLGHSFLSEGDKYNAKMAFFDSLEHDPKHVPTLVSIGNILLSENHPQQAIAYLTKAIDIDPNTAIIHAALGEAYAVQSDFPRSLYHLNRATELDPTYGGAFCSAAAVNMETKNYDRVEKYILRLREIQKDPQLMLKQTGVPLAQRIEGLGKLIATKSQTLAAQRNWVEAASVGKLMLLALPDNFDSGTLYVAILMELKKFEEAESLLKVFHKKDPNHLKVNLLIFSLLQKQNREAEAAAMLFQLNNTNPQLYQQLMTLSTSKMLDLNKVKN